MAQPTNKLSQFWQELKRRNVVRVITVYAAASFVILQLVEILAPSLRLPEWTMNFILVLLIVGFIIAVILSWVYDVHPEGGIVKTEPAQKVKEVKMPGSSRNWKIASYISFVVIVGLIVLNIIPRTGKKEILDKSVAVLPILNLSGDPDQEHISDGLTNDVIAALSKIRSFDKVVSLTSVLTYKGKDKSSREIAEELGVNYILESTYSRSAGQLRITTNLVEPKKDRSLWQDEYLKPFEEMVTIQPEIALQIANHLEAYISKSEKRTLRTLKTNNQEAWENYQLGLYYKNIGDRNYGNLNKARQLFDEAIEHDPDFVLAYTELSEIYLMLFWFKFDRSPYILAESREAIDVAFSIEPDLPEAYIALARYYYTAFLDYPRSLELLNEVSKIMPEHPDLFLWRAYNYRRMGEWEKAVAQFEKARELDPRNPSIIGNLLSTYYLMKQYDKAQHCLDLSFEIDSSLFQNYDHQAMIYIMRDGDAQKADMVYDEMKRRISFEELINNAFFLSPIQLEIYKGNYQKVLNFIDSTDWSGMINMTTYYPNTLIQARMYNILGFPQKAVLYYDSARMEIERRLIQLPNDPVLIGALGVSYAGLGDNDRAIQLGEQAVEEYSLEKDAFFGTARYEELAWIYVMVGNYVKALENIDLLLSNPSFISFQLLKLDPKWKPLWDHPEFIRLTDKYAVK
jgi:TolB-like protein